MEKSISTLNIQVLIFKIALILFHYFYGQEGYATKPGHV